MHEKILPRDGVELITARVEFLQCKTFGKMFLKSELTQGYQQKRVFSSKKRGKKEELSQSQLSNPQRLIENGLFF